jgi:hypothetical protein
MKRLIKGIEKLNKEHYRISGYISLNMRGESINEITYTNDLHYENHDVKLLKYKQFLYFFPKSYYVSSFFNNLE